MSTAPGKRGGIGALGVIESLLPRFGAEISATFSLPFFQENFDSDSGITDPDLAATHKDTLQRFLNSL